MLITYIMYYLVKSELKHKHVVKHNMYSVLVFFLRFKMTSFQLCVHFFIYDLQMHKTEKIYGSSCSQCTHTITTGTQQFCGLTVQFLVYMIKMYFL